jgi:hypothetical protein
LLEPKAPPLLELCEEAFDNPLFRSEAIPASSKNPDDHSRKLAHFDREIV